MPIDTMPATDAVPTDEVAPEPVPTSDDAELVADELLVEEISIDGMCGVY